jgi:hypothetical protein
MFTISLGNRWRRGALVSTAGLATLLAFALDARAVILYSTPDRNTDPTPIAGAWNLEAQWGEFLATPIDPTHFIAAKHVNLASSTVSLVYQGNTLSFAVNSSSRREDPNSDLVIYSLQSGYTFPIYAPLYSTAVDGSEIGRTMTVIGRGTQRGSSVLVDGTVAGWRWGSRDDVQSWGQNVVSGLIDYDSASQNSLLYFEFDANGVPNEAALSLGDSSGAVFINSGGRWKLAGINFAIDSPWSYVGGSDTGFNADVFDARGLYFRDTATTWAQIPFAWAHPVPGASYASAISQRLGWIEATIPSLLPGDASGDGAVNGTDLNIVLSNYNQTGRQWAQGDFNGDGSVDGADLNIVLSNYNQSISSSAALTVPEPGALVLLGSAGAFLWLASCRRWGRHSCLPPQ